MTRSSCGVWIRYKHRTCAKGSEPGSGRGVRVSPWGGCSRSSDALGELAGLAAPALSTPPRAAESPPWVPSTAQAAPGVQEDFRGLGEKKNFFFSSEQPPPSSSSDHTPSCLSLLRALLPRRPGHGGKKYRYIDIYPYLPVANIPPGTGAPRSSPFRAQSGVPGRCCTLGAHPCRVGKDSPRCREHKEVCGLESELKLSPRAQVKVSCKLNGTASRRPVRTLQQPAAHGAHTIFANTGLTANVTPAKLPYSKLRCQLPPLLPRWLPPLPPPT